MECLFGCPASLEGREEREARTYAFLDGLGVSYARVDHDSAETMEICREIEGTLGAPICKNLFLCNRQGTVFYLLMMPGDKPFKTKELSAQINASRLFFASPEKMLELLDIRPGSVSVLGLMNDRERGVHLLVDEDVLKQEYVGCHPCVNTSTLRIRTADLLEKILPATGHTVQTVRLVGEV